MLYANVCPLPFYPSDKPELNPAARTWIFHQPTRAQGLSAPLVHCSAWRLVRGSRTARLFETVDCVLWCWRPESILGRDIFLLFFFLTSDLSLLLCLSAHPPPPVAGPSHHRAQLRHVKSEAHLKPWVEHRPLNSEVTVATC